MIVAPTTREKSVAIAAEQHGDPTAIEVYRLCGEYLGKGLSILIDLFNPERIVIGSIFTRSRAGLWESCKEVIEKEALAVSWSCCEVVPAKLLEGIGDYADLYRVNLCNYTLVATNDEKMKEEMKNITKKQGDES